MAVPPKKLIFVHFYQRPTWGTVVAACFLQCDACRKVSLARSDAPDARRLSSAQFSQCTKCWRISPQKIRAHGESEGEREY